MPDTLPLRLLVYSSAATRPMDSVELVRLSTEAARNNALGAITGLLVFTGSHFAQLIEGADDAIDDLLEKLGRDERHRDIRIACDVRVSERAFPDWNMRLIEVPAERAAALSAVESQLPHRLSPDAKSALKSAVATGL